MTQPPLLAVVPCYVPHLLLDTGALKTTGGKAEVPSLHKEGWLRPLRKCRPAKVASRHFIDGRSHTSFAKDSCSCMFAEWFCTRRPADSVFRPAFIGSRCTAKKTIHRHWKHNPRAVPRGSMVIKNTKVAQGRHLSFDVELKTQARAILYNATSFVQARSASGLL